VYRVLTGLLAVFVVLAALPDLFAVPQAVTLFERLGYPLYLLPFLGAAKLLAVVGILVPRFRRIKEWAYAGLAFDFSGALYSHVSVGDPIAAWWALPLGALLLVGSYACYQTTSRSSAEPV
jgi:hypothetical protein